VRDTCLARPANGFPVQNTRTNSTQLAPTDAGPKHPGVRVHNKNYEYKILISCRPTGTCTEISETVLTLENSGVIFHVRYKPGSFNWSTSKLTHSGSLFSTCVSK